jgi:hypothetical protein
VHCHELVLDAYTCSASGDLHHIACPRTKRAVSWERREVDPRARGLMSTSTAIHDVTGSWCSDPARPAHVMDAHVMLAHVAIASKPKHVGSRVSGYGSRVSGLGFRVSGFGLWVSGFTRGEALSEEACVAILKMNASRRDL